MKRIVFGIATLAAGLTMALPAQAAKNVKVTPLGSVDGEFCRFENPDITRILYDAGRTVAGPDDPRLGKIDAVLISHVHGDHLGDRRIEKVNDGTGGSGLCGQFPGQTGIGHRLACQ